MSSLHLRLSTFASAILLLHDRDACVKLSVMSELQIQNVMVRHFPKAKLERLQRHLATQGIRASKGAAVRYAAIQFAEGLNGPDTELLSPPAERQSA